jgi:hypothetical protein
MVRGHVLMVRRQLARGETAAVERIQPEVVVRIPLAEVEVERVLQMAVEEDRILEEVAEEERLKLVVQPRLAAVELHRACPHKRR